MDGAEVLTLLKLESAKRQKMQNAFMALVAICVALPVLAFVAQLVRGKPFDSGDWLGYLGLLGLVGASVGAGPNLKSLTLQASALDDVAVVPSLIEALHFGDAAVAETSRAALIRLLPKLQPDSDVVRDLDWHALLQGCVAKDPGLDLAIIGLLERVATKSQVVYLDAYGAGQHPERGYKLSQRATTTALNAAASVRMRMAKELVDQRVQLSESALQTSAEEAKLPPLGH